MNKNGLEFLIDTIISYSDKWKVDIITGLWFYTNGNITIDDIMVKDKYFDSRGYSNDRRKALNEMVKNLLNKLKGDFRLLLVSKKIELGEYGPHLEQEAVHCAARGKELLIDKLNFTENEKKFIKNNEFDDLGLVIISTEEDKPKYIDAYTFECLKFDKGLKTLKGYKENIIEYVLKNYENTSKSDLRGFYDNAR